MAEPGTEPAPSPQQAPNLIYLGFFHLAAIKLITYVASLYEYAKQHSGGLKPSLEGLERKLRAVFGPTYERFKDTPLIYLIAVDQKVAVILKRMDDIVPPTLKEKTLFAYGVVRQTPDTAKSVLTEVQEKGLITTTRAYYCKYGPAAEKQLYASWQRARAVPIIKKVVLLLTPPALVGIEKYNGTVQTLKASRFPLAKTAATYLPFLPRAQIEKTLKGE